MPALTYLSDVPLTTIDDSFPEDSADLFINGWWCERFRGTDLLAVTGPTWTATSSVQGVWLLDISNPSSPTIIDRWWDDYDGAGTDSPNEDMNRMVSWGDDALLFARWEGSNSGVDDWAVAFRIIPSGTTIVPGPVAVLPGTTSGSDYPVAGAFFERNDTEGVFFYSRTYSGEDARIGGNFLGGELWCVTVTRDASNNISFGTPIDVHSVLPNIGSRVPLTFGGAAYITGDKWLIATAMQEPSPGTDVDVYCTILDLSGPTNVSSVTPISGVSDNEYAWDNGEMSLFSENIVRLEGLVTAFSNHAFLSTLFVPSGANEGDFYVIKVSVSTGETTMGTAAWNYGDQSARSNYWYGSRGVMVVDNTTTIYVSGKQYTVASELGSAETVVSPFPHAGGQDSSTEAKNFSDRPNFCSLSPDGLIAGVSGAHIGIWTMFELDTTIPPLRLNQRDDALGISPTPRLNAGQHPTSRQSLHRVGNGATQYL